MRRGSPDLRNFYPRPLRGGRLSFADGAHLLHGISIHALCEEGDDISEITAQAFAISIHALCEEGDGDTLNNEEAKGYFYPRPLRGGRRGKCEPRASTTYFYPRPLRGGRHELDHGQRAQVISIHALCEEGDALADEQIAAINEFLSTPSARRATEPRQQQPRPVPISIHALCEEGDRGPGTPHRPLGYFYPRPLRGGRRLWPTSRSRPSTNFYPRPLRGGRRQILVTVGVPSDFYPRPLRGGRLSRSTSKVNRSVFLSTPSARRATRQRCRRLSAAWRISIHALCEEGDPAKQSTK